MLDACLIETLSLDRRNGKISQNVWMSQVFFLAIKFIVNTYKLHLKSLNESVSNFGVALFGTTRVMLFHFFWNCSHYFFHVDIFSHFFQFLVLSYNEFLLIVVFYTLCSVRIIYWRGVPLSRSLFSWFWRFLLGIKAISWIFLSRLHFDLSFENDNFSSFALINISSSSSIVSICDFSHVLVKGIASKCFLF